MHLGNFSLKKEFHFLKTTKRNLVLMRYAGFGANVGTKEALIQPTHLKLQPAVSACSERMEKVGPIPC